VASAAIAALNVGRGDTAKEIVAKTPATWRSAIAKPFRDTAPIVLRVLHLPGEEFMLQAFGSHQACRHDARGADVRNRVLVLREQLAHNAP